MKSILRLKLLWILEIAFLFIGVLVVLKFRQQGHKVQSRQSPPDASSAQNTTLSKKDIKQETKPQYHDVYIKKLVVCLDVEKGEPILAKQVFGKFVDKLYCYSIINVDVGDQAVLHQWIYKDQVEYQEEFELSRGENTVWSANYFSPEQNGDWRVDILDKNNKIVDGISFRLE